MHKVRYAVIGLGRFGEVHCEAIAGLADAELAAVCTRRPERLREVAARFGTPRTCTDYRQLLEDDSVDAVSVVTMWHEHREPAVAALRAGKHVFVEKPLASTRADCDAIVAAAQSAAGMFMVGHICRFNPRYTAARAAIAEGRIGKIVSMYARRNIPAQVSGPILDKIGPIVGDGVHDTDLMLWFSGARVVSAFAHSVNVRGHKFPDIGWTMYRFDSGAVGVLENAWFLPEKCAVRIDERMEIIGTEGSIHIQEGGPNLFICDREGWQAPDTTYWPRLDGVRGGALREELAYFTRCIQGGRRPTIITAEESRSAVLACLAAEESAASGAVVPLASEGR
jgi:UDP-N-acetylglucosamine 3-dehydrogenase